MTKTYYVGVAEGEAPTSAKDMVFNAWERVECSMEELAVMAFRKYIRERGGIENLLKGHVWIRETMKLPGVVFTWQFWVKPDANLVECKKV